MTAREAVICHVPRWGRLAVSCPSRPDAVHVAQQMAGENVVAQAGRLGFQIQQFIVGKRAEVELAIEIPLPERAFRFGEPFDSGPRGSGQRCFPVRGIAL